MTFQQEGIEQESDPLGEQKTHCIFQVERDRHFFQDLFSHSVGAGELQQDVGLENVLDQGDAVLSLLLCESLCLGGLERPAKVSKLGYAVKGCCLLLSLSRFKTSQS